MRRSAPPDRDRFPAGPRTILMVAALLVAVAGGRGLAAQAAEKIPKRPHLKADRDTNSALSYYSDGSDVLDIDPERADADFYWARKIDPTWAAPIYGEYCARILELSNNRIADYFRTRYDPKRSADFLSIDSLAWQAHLKNPFVDRRLDGMVLSAWVRRLGGSDALISEAAFHDVVFSAWYRYAHGDFRKAAERYADALKEHPKSGRLHIDRAKSFFAMGEIDSARAEVRTALTMERTRESEGPIGWVSQTFLEYSLGFLYRMGDQGDSATAAYTRSLLDDLTFHPAHHELAITRLAAHDTAGALTEYGSAVTLAPADAAYLYEYGLLLLLANHADSAVNILKRATTSDPYFASPHYLLGVLYEKYDFVPDATAELTTFINLAPASLGPTLETAKAKLAKLQAAH